MPIPQNFLDKIASNNKDLVELNLSRQRPPLTDVDMQQLATALKNNTVVEEIALCENSIGDQGAIALADVLSRNPSIKMLDLSVNNLTNKGVLALLNIPTLRELDIAANKLDDAIVSSFLENQTITLLIIGGNKISQKRLESIDEHIQKNARRKISRLFQQALEIASKTLPPDKHVSIKREFSSLADQMLKIPSSPVGTLFETPMLVSK